MIDVSGLKISLDAGLPENRTQAISEIAQQLGIKSSQILNVSLLKRSVDARKKSNVHFTASYRVEVPEKIQQRLLSQTAKKNSRLKGLNINASKPYTPLEIPALSAPQVAPVVVGAGPAGLFAAWYLAKCGLNPILIEQGAPVEERQHDVAEFFENGTLKPYSNIQFGEGGAGTFSDGKLTTNTKNRYTTHVLHWFVEAGAPEDILWQAHPHLGSDNLARIVKTIRKSIIELGGKVLFHTQLTHLTFENETLCSISLKNLQTGQDQTRSCEVLVLACGHSARSTFELVRESGLVMEQKPFSMGVRIEHSQAAINESQWGSAACHPALGAAEYKLAIHLPSGRSVYSFCMCPGGEVVAAASEEGGVVTNGMSNYARNGKNANAALLVNVDPSDFGSCDVLAGVDLQRRVEQKAYQVARAYGAEPYQAPAQTVGAFLAGAAAGKGAACWSVHRDLTNKATQKTAGDSVSAASQDCASHFCVPTYERGVVEAPLDEVLPNFVATSLREALPLMGKKIKGFDNPQAILTGPETRSSSPVRICRSELLQAYFPNTDAKNENQPSRTGLYPCGEGPGFAGGIMSAAVDGMKVAKAVADCYQAQKKAACLEEVLAALNNGLPAIFPTDTVFGLGVSVRAAKTPEALFALKQRPNSKPVAWLVGSVDALDAYGSNVPEWAKRLADQCWPGALTLVVNASKEVPLAYQSSEGTIALRMPNHPDALALLEKVGPLATTSANLSGENAPTTPAEISTQLTQAVPVLWGETHDGKASAVVDATGATPQILREGPFNIAACLCAIENF